MELLNQDIETQSNPQSPRMLQIGPDRVTVADGEVTIHAKNRMPDWEVRDLNPIPIYFEDKKYDLVQAVKAEPPYAVRYLLHPWPEGHVSGAKAFWSYDQESVNEREASSRSGTRDEIIRMGLLPFYPFLGLLWSKMQERLERFGFVARNITGVSIFTVFCMAFAQGVFAVVMIQASVRSGKIMLGGMVRALVAENNLHVGPVSIPFALLDVLLLLACIADVLVRYSRYLREDQWNGGFLEWLLPKSLRNK